MMHVIGPICCRTITVDVPQANTNIDELLVLDAKYEKRPLGWLKSRYDDQFLVEVRKSSRAALTRHKTQKQDFFTGGEEDP